MVNLSFILSVTATSSSSETRNYKRFLKRNLPNVGMAGWRHWLTKYTDKESTFHNIATFHTTISQWHATIFTATYVGI